MKTVCFDIDTQYDFLLPAGALSVPHAERIIPAIASLNRWAAQHAIPVISTTDAHAENDPEFRVWPPHCVAGAWGQRKPDATLLNRRVTVPLKCAQIGIGAAQQIVLEKQSLNCFDNPNLNGILSGFEAGRYLVYGVVTEICVALAARGLLRTGARVEIVTDAIAELKRDDAGAALREITTAGGRLTTLAAVLAS